MKPHRILIGLTSVAVLLVACGGGSSTEESTTIASTSTVPPTTVAKSTTTSSSSSSTSTTVPVVVREPLTGEPVASAADIDQRPAMVVKIDNVPDGRKNQTGIANADIVFEEIVEGQATRFGAIFHSKSAKPIGPIRSGRTQDIALFSSFNSPLFVWSGGNGGVTRAINDSTLVNMGPNYANGYYRGVGAKPHNLYNDTDTIWAQTPADQPGPPAQQYQYLDANETFGGDASSGVALSVGSTKVEWTYDSATGTYSRKQNGTPHIDQTYGPVAAKNVIIMGVQYQPSPVDRNSPEAQTVGEGPVYIFSDGKVVEGRWSRELGIYPLEFNDLDGKPIKLQPGNTWIELAKEVSTIDPNKSGVDLLVKPA
jgi:hypothetical protein